MTIRGSLAFCAMLVGAFAITYSWSAGASAARAPESGTAAPNFTLRDANGADLKLSDFQGKVVLLNFWATWCGPCRIEIPWFEEYAKKYEDRGLAVIGISMDEEGWQSVKPFMAKSGITYPVAIGTEPISQLYGGIESLPTTILIDRQGRVAARHKGLVGRSTYDAEIRKLLGS